jgi:hypothetical protein
MTQSTFTSSSLPSSKSCRYRNPTASGQCRWNPATESSHLCRNLVSLDSGDHIPAIWPEQPAGRNRAQRPDPRQPVLCRNSAVLAGIQPTQIPTKLFGFRPLSWILVIVAGMAESGKSGRNPVGQ